MKKRALAAVSALIMAFACMTACGNSSSTSDAKSSSTPEGSSSVSESTADSSASSPESAADSKPGSESKPDSKSDASSDSDSSTTEEKQGEEEVLLKVEHFTPSGELIYTQTREYVKNNKGEPVPSKFTITGDKTRSQAASIESAARYEYDDNYKHCKYYNEKNEMSSETFYNDEGLKIKSLMYKSGRVNDTYLYEYDNNQNITKETYYFGTQDKYISMRVTTYSYKDGRLASEHTDNKFQTGKSTSADKTYEYDSNGNVVRTTTVDSVGSKTIVSSTYDAKNNRTSSKTESLIAGSMTVASDFHYEYTYNADSYVKVTLPKTKVKNNYGREYYPTSKQTYSGDDLTEEIIYSPQEALKGNFESVLEIVKYTYGTV